MITIKDIAKELGLHHTTVSRALNNKEDKYISTATREKVIAMAKKLNYVPNYSAKNLATGKTNLIAVLWSGIYLPYHNSMLKEIQEVLKKDNYNYISVSYDVSKADKLLPFAVDGVICFGNQSFLTLYERATKKINIPTVFLSTASYNLCDNVLLDYYNGSIKALKHLYKNGARDIMYFLLEQGNNNKEPRIVAYKEFIEKNKLKENILVFSNKKDLYDDINLTSDYLYNYLKENKKPDAIFCYYDEMAIGAYKAIKRLGLSAPEDIMIVGYNGSDITQIPDTPISTVAAQYKKAAQVTWDFLKNRIKNKDIPIQSKVIDTKLIIRKSSEP